MINRARSRKPARGEHAFRVIKQLWGFAEVRYRGLAKNLARAHTMFALANLYQVRRPLLPAGARCRCEETSGSKQSLRRLSHDQPSLDLRSLNRIVTTTSTKSLRTATCTEPPQGVPRTWPRLVLAP